MFTSRGPWLKTKHQRIPISNLIWAKILEYALLWPIHGPNYKSLFCNTTIHWYVTFLYIHTLTLTLCIKRLLLSHLFYFWFNSPCKLYIKDKEMAKALMQGAKYRHRKRHEQKKRKKNCPLHWVIACTQSYESFVKVHEMTDTWKSVVSR